MKGGARGRIRTFINLFLRQAPLPVGLRVRTDLGIGIWDFGFVSCEQDRRGNLYPIPNPKSHIRNRNGPGSRIRTCEHLLPRQAQPGFGNSECGSRICLVPGVKSQIRIPKSQIGMASGKGVEPLFAGSEPTVLPVRRTRIEISGRDGGTRTR